MTLQGCNLPAKDIILTDVPHIDSLDSSIAVLREGYEFIGRQSRRLQSDVFRGRLMGKSTIFMTGARAAELFYDTSRFRRSDALPLLVQKTLFGRRGVQTLDDAQHRERKALFMELMTRGQLQQFVELAEAEWLRAIEGWQRRRRVVLFDEAQRVLCQAACAWAGVTIDQRELVALVRDCHAMVDGFAGVGPRMLRALAGRRRAEHWARGVIASIRAGQRSARPGTAAQLFAERRNASGELLPLDVAAVELLNIIRPITAISWWIAFVPLALRDHPTHREGLASDERFVEDFVQEVRRFYPFTPFLGARARHDFEWQNVTFRSGELAILDVFGTLRDPRIWERPDEFLPERFAQRTPTPFDFIPNGGGDFFGGHRCAGEWLTVEALALATRVLTRRLDYELPRQDLGFTLHRIPTRPASGVVLAGVRIRSNGAQTAARQSELARPA
jgi:fatty-acid peroxygenase